MNQVKAKEMHRIDPLERIDTLERDAQKFKEEL